MYENCANTIKIINKGIKLIYVKVLRKWIHLETRLKEYFPFLR